MTHIDYYMTSSSPFVYLAGARPAEIAAKHGATLTYKPLETWELFRRTGGKPQPERHESRKAMRLQEMRRQATKLGMPINLHPAYWPVNAAPAGYAIIAAQKTGGGDITALVTGLSRACWVEERDISDDAVIRDFLGAAGFDPALADSGLLTGAETYAANLEEAVARGVFGVPFFAVGEELFFGQDRLDDLDLHLAGRL